MQPGRVKPLLVRAASDFLPAAISNRPKQGFTLPFEHWMRGELREEITMTFTPDACARVGLVPRGVHAVWESYLQRRSGMSWSRPWALYTLLRWVERQDLNLDTSDSRLTSPGIFAGT